MKIILWIINLPIRFFKLVFEKLVHKTADMIAVFIIIFLISLIFYFVK